MKLSIEFDLYSLQEAIHILHRKDRRMQIALVHTLVSVSLYELTIKPVHSSVNVFACLQQTVHDSTFCRRTGMQEHIKMVCASEAKDVRA